MVARSGADALTHAGVIQGAVNGLLQGTGGQIPQQWHGRAAAGAVGGGLDFSYTIEGLQTLSVTASGNTLNPFGSDTYTHAMREYSFGAAYGESNIRVNAVSDSIVNKTSGNDVTYDMPATSNLFTVTGGTFHFNGGKIKVKIRAPYDAPTGTNDPYVQSYTFEFPAVASDLPTPGYVPNSSGPGG